MTSEGVERVAQVDPDETDEAILQRGRRRRRLMWLAAATALIAGAALVVARPWQGDDDEASGSSQPPVVTVDDAAPAAELPYLLFGTLADDMTPQFANDPGQMIDDMGLVTYDLTLFADDGATAADGRWVTVSVQVLDRFERRNFDPRGYLSGDSVAVRVGDLDGAIADQFDDTTALLFGPVDDGYAVTLTAHDLERTDVLRLAEELRLVESEDAVGVQLGDTAGDLGLTPRTAMQLDSWGMTTDVLGSMLFSSPQSRSASWAGPTGNDAVNLAIGPTPRGADIGVLARFYLADVEEVTVRDHPAFAGTFGAAFGFGSVVLWEEGGAWVLVSSQGEVDDAIALAQGVRDSDAGEWADVVDAANEAQEAPAMPGEAWLIGVGELPDSTTWTVEGGIDSDGRLVLCTWAAAGDGSSTSGCGSGIDVAASAPGITAALSVGFGDGASVPFVAFVDLAEEGAMLRFTTDDGDVSSAPIDTVHEDWPVRAGALLPAATGTLAIVAADGTVLAELVVTEEMLTGSWSAVPVG